MKIKIKVLDPACKPTIIKQGDWIDLRAAEDVLLEHPYACAKSKKGNDSTRRLVIATKLIPLGVIIKVPKGMECIVVPRSSSYKKFHILQANSFGVIDQSYCGPNDEWKMPVIALGKALINKGDRVCQFRVQPSQKATFWQKLKWLFSKGVKIEFTDNIASSSRGGFGSTGR